MRQFTRQRFETTKAIAKRLRQVALAGLVSVAFMQDVQASESTPPDDSAALTARVKALESQMQYLNDYHQITELLTRFFRGVNRNDVELVKSTFWPDAKAYRGGKLFRADEFIVAVTDGYSYSKEYASHQHHVTNHTVDIDGDVAHIESYVVAFWRNKDGKTTRIGGVRYLDMVERRNNEWRIATHDFIPTFWIEANSIFESVFEKFPQSACAMGTMDRRDPSYRRPLTRPSDAIAAGPACAE